MRKLERQAERLLEEIPAKPLALNTGIDREPRELTPEQTSAQRARRSDSVTGSPSWFSRVKSGAAVPCSIKRCSSGSEGGPRSP